MAELCRRPWVVIRLCWSDGQTLAAAVRCLATRYSTASALSRVPRAVGNNTCSSPRDGSRNHAFKTAIVDLARGVHRSLRPLPMTRRWAPVPSVASFRVSAVNSDKRSPVWTATKSNA